MDPSLIAMFKSVGVDPTKLNDEQLNMMSKLYEGLVHNDPKSMEDIEKQLDAKKLSPKKKDKTGRNEKCGCGSGKKYKYCCL